MMAILFTLILIISVYVFLNEKLKQATRFGWLAGVLVFVALYIIFAVLL